MCPCQALLCVHHCCWLEGPKTHGKQGMLHLIAAASARAGENLELDQKLTPGSLMEAAPGKLGPWAGNRPQMAQSSHHHEG